MLRDAIEKNKKIESNTAFLEELRKKLPAFFKPEKIDEHGTIIEEASFDLTKFQNELQRNNIHEFIDGYQLDFIGKNYAKKQAGEASVTVICPDMTHNNKKENQHSKNLFFTGDNLEVLRHLQNNY